MERENGFCYLGDSLNASGGCEVAVTVRAKISWPRFRNCGELIFESRFPMKMKDIVYCCCVQSAILYESKTKCWKDNERAILSRIERAMVRATGSQKVIDKKTIEKAHMLGLKVTVDELEKSNTVRRDGDVLRRMMMGVSRAAVDFEVSGKRKQGRPKKT